MTTNSLQQYLEITTTVDLVIVNEGNYFIAYCPALELSVNAPTVEKVQDNFKQEAKIFLEEINNRGTLEKYLLKNGWSLKQFPDFKYEPPRLNTNIISNLLKSSEKVIPIDVTININ